MKRSSWIGIASLVAVVGCGVDDAREASEAYELHAQRPHQRAYGTLIWDSQSKAYVLMGGNEGGWQPFDDIWTADATGKKWERTGTLAPGALDCAAYSTAHDRIVAFVSFRPRPEGGSPGSPPIDTVSETWTYDVDANRWEQLTTTGSPPPGLVGSRLSYDVESDRFIMFGGLDIATFAWSSDTWAFDLGSRTWTNMQPASHPTGRNFHGQLYHAASDRVLSIAGFDENFELTNHVWAYDYNTNTWTQIPSNGPPRDYVAVTYLSARATVLLYGGVTYGPDFEEVAEADTWEYDLAANTWTRIDDATPGPRGWHSLAYSPKSDSALLFSGGPTRASTDQAVFTYRDGEWED